MLFGAKLMLVLCKSSFLVFSSNFDWILFTLRIYITGICEQQIWCIGSFEQFLAVVNGLGVANPTGWCR